MAARDGLRRKVGIPHFSYCSVPNDRRLASVGQEHEGTMKHEFYAAISQIAAERGIPKDAILEVMEKALVTAYRRTLGNNPPPIEVSVKLDPQSGMARVFAEKQVVDEVFDDRFEVDFDVAKRIKADVELGETILIE